MPSPISLKTILFLQLQLVVYYYLRPSLGLPSGFVDEGVVNLNAITGAFAPNPRNNGKPMLLLSSKEGQVVVLEDPDNSIDYITIADFENIMCHNGERGLESIRPHPDFANNRYIYMFYSLLLNDCIEDAEDGPPNRLSRFTMDADSLEIDLNTEVVLMETPPTPHNIHNGGNIAFGNDGMLYVTTGDGGTDVQVSQDLGHLHGKILRLSDDGSIPSDNPYANEGIPCGSIGGRISTGICAEVFAIGFRNPFRLAMDPNTLSKVKFHIGDVGGSKWEEITIGGTDYAKANYGWPLMEGPCERNDNSDCPLIAEYLDPFHYYEHTQAKEGGCVTGSVFVPDGLWPSEYKYLFIDFIFGEIYNLIEDASLLCRDCVPPTSGYRNETFYALDYMVDAFFGPYQDTSALYIVSQSRVEARKIRRIYYTGSTNRSPVASVNVSSTRADVGDIIFFDGTNSSDPDGDPLTYMWDFGDDNNSTEELSSHFYSKKGEYIVELTVTDSSGQSDQTSTTVQVGDPPTAKMLSPVFNYLFYVGDVIRLKGSAVDSAGNALPDSQLSWEVRKHHATHFHPFLDRQEGNDFDLPATPGPEDVYAATNSYLEVIMYAVDGDGLTTTVTRNVYPLLINIEIDTFPSGLEMLIDGTPIVTPTIITSWENHSLHLDVEDQPPYYFTSWSDGGNRSHYIILPKASMTMLSFNATFAEASIPLSEDIRNCSISDTCGACEGHCESDDECQDTLYCFKKGGRGFAVPGCVGIDQSNTDWCTRLPITGAPIVAPTVLPELASPAPSVALSAAPPTSKPTASPTLQVSTNPIAKPTADVSEMPTIKLVTTKPTSASGTLSGKNTTEASGDVTACELTITSALAFLVSALLMLT